MKRIIATLMSLAMLIPLISVDVQAVDTSSTTLPAEEVDPIEYYDESTEIPAAIPDDVLWITNEDGVAETQEIFYLPEDGSLPDYITDIEYLDNSDTIYVDEDLPDDEFILEPSEDEYSLIEIPLYLPLNSGNIISTDEIRLLETAEFATTHIQIYDPESDIAILDTDFPITEAYQIILSEGQEYWVSLVTDYGSYFDSYYGTLAVFAGTLEITGGWHFTTDKADLVATESDIEPYGTTMNEREPNNSQYTATTYENDADMYGTISSTSDVDYFKVTFGRDGKANFYLGNIPKDCNYDMKIYYQSASGGGLTLYRTLATSGSYEQVLNLPVESDKTYYMQVYSSKGSSTTEKYQVRAKITPIDDSYEPNNSFETAKSISTYGYIDATIHKSSDIDYYFVNCTSGVLDVSLSNIPWGCDYRFIVYDSSRKKISEVSESGYNDKKLSIPTSYGKYYIAVYSKSGSNQTNKYRLKASTRSSYITVSGYMNCDIKQLASNKNTQSTPISELPIQIVYIPRNKNTYYTLKSTTTNSTGWFSAMFSLPSDAERLFIKAYAQDSEISIRLNDDTVFTKLFEIPFNAASISFDAYSKAATEQTRASLSLWRLGKQCLDVYNVKGSQTYGQLIIRCSEEQDVGTYSDRYGRYIQVNGKKDKIDYYDYDILLHEVGHWIMKNMGGSPLGSGGEHNWYELSTPATAYSEGWAHYFSCIMRDDSTIYDYNSDNKRYGADLQTGYTKPGYSSTLAPTSKRTTYVDNARMEVFVGSSLWNLSRAFGTSYSQMERLAKTRREDWKEFYDAYMDSLSTSNLKPAWEICEKFGIAYDLELPKVNLTISNLVAKMSATDNVSVESFEWYVDGQLKGRGTGKSGSINLNNFGLPAGTHTVECRVYDPEGKATGNRPRRQRYQSATQNFIISNLTSVRADNIELKPLMGENVVESQSDLISLPLAADCTYIVNSLGNMDISVSMCTNGAIKAIEIYTPSGDLYESVSYIAPDAPYVIRNADAGEWQITITNYTADEIMDIVSEQGEGMAYSVIQNLPDTEVGISLATFPTSVEVDMPTITNNPNILKEIFDDGNIIVTEDGQLIDFDTPLVDGIHELSVAREIGGMYSEATKYTVEVDTVAPEIMLVDFYNTTNRDRFLLQIKSSENIASVTVNDEMFECNFCGGSSSYADAFMLEPGVNWFSLVVTDYAGNSSYETFSVERLQ